MQKKVLFLFLFLVSVFSFSAYSDTIPIISSDSLLIGENKILTATVESNSYIKKYSDFSFNPANEFKVENDISLSYFHRYNPAYRKFNYTLGNLGLAHNSFVFNPNLHPGFNYGINNFELWELSLENISHFSTRIPYTEANVVVGSKKEQYFKGIHTQNITKNWNFSFQFNKVKSLGFYENQQSDVTNIAAQTNYLSEDKKYGVLAKAFFNKVVAGENGGLSDENYIDDDSRLTLVNISSAYNRRNSRGFNVKQYYNFTTLIDSFPDSDTSFVYNYKVHKGFSHSISYNDYRMVYKDLRVNSAYYPSIYRDSLSTFDSIQFKTVSNEIEWNDYNKLLMYRLTMEHQYSEVNFNSGGESFFFSDYFLKSSFNRSKRTAYFWQLNSSFIIAGDHKGDYKLNGKLEYNLNKNNLFFIDVSVIQSSPFFMYNYYSSNHFQWHNNFEKNQIISAVLSYSNPKIKFNSSFKSSLLNNHIYLNNYAIPQQFLSQSVVSIARVEKNITWKRFNLSTELIYQHVTTPGIIRIPDLISRNALFYEFGSTKDLKLQIGIEGFYFTSFKNYRYMPVTGQFFLQDEQFQGNYPLIDFFVNMRIKQARVFFKIDHLNETPFNREFFILPGYPAGERAFRVGISWIFYN